jgi:thiosulfate reductase cytochrome b subunit
MIHETVTSDLRPAQNVLHPFMVRITHWLNALAIIVMIGSGWRIYNQEPLFGFRFPVWMTLGGRPKISQHWHNEEGLAGALQWHFAAMWLLFVSLAAYLVYGLISGHFRRSLLPVRPQEVMRDLLAACDFDPARRRKPKWRQTPSRRGCSDPLQSA